jgi:DNA invertase Pin-like site-specific DNA recombinase
MNGKWKGGVSMRKITIIAPPVPALPRRKKTAAYVRVSVENDRTKNSFSAQVSYFSKLIQNNPEWEYSGVYADCGETGTVKTRSEFERLLEDCEAGKIDIVLVKSISRFARNTVDLLETVRRLKELGIEVRFEKENINSMSAEGELMLTILASFAQEESRSTSENIKWAIRRGFQKGRQSSTQIYGYRWDGENFVVQPDEAEIVRFIFSEYLAGKSPHKITAELNEKGVKPLYGERFWQRTIISILENEKYIGIVVMQKTFVENHITKNKVRNNGELPRYIIENAHPAIIDKATFEAVQERLVERKIKVERTPFTSKILGEVCGLNFQRATKHYKDNRTKVMTCANKKHGKPCNCDTKEIPETVLESVTAEVLGIPEFDADIFTAKIKQIVVPSKNRIVFHFHSGKTITREWKSTANVDCWTPERRAAQAARLRGNSASEEHRKAQSEGMKAYYAANPERRKADSERMKKFCAENPDWCKEQSERLTAHNAESKAKKGGAL